MPLRMSIILRQKGLRAALASIRQITRVRQKSLHATLMPVRVVASIDKVAYDPELTALNWTMTPKHKTLQTELTAVSCL